MFSRVAKPVPPPRLLGASGGLRQARSSVLTRLFPRLVQLIRGSLRAKFIFVIVSLITMLMGTVTFVVDRHQRRAILEQTRLRAFDLGASLAAVSGGYLLNYNYIQLEQATEKVTAENDDVMYAVAHGRDGKVAVFSGRTDLQGNTLDDPVSQRALQADKPLVQKIIMPQTREPGYDVAIPVYAPRSPQKWGTIRLGFSLARAYELIHQTRRDLLLLSLGAVLGSTMLAILLAMRISKPIGQLVAGVHEFAKGSYDHPITLNAHDEIGYLAHAFEQMRTSLQLHLISLADEKRLLEEANHRLQETQQQLVQTERLALEEANRRLQETQQQLIQTERLAAVGTLAARVAHEVNNPLAIVKTAIRILRNQSKNDDPAQENLQVIEEEISRVARIIRELLDFSRPRPSDEVVQVNTVLQSMQGLLTQDLHEKGITLKVISEQGLPLVRLSADQLKQVILNIVRNAEDAMPEGGDLVIRTARKGKGVEVSIADTGCGIPAEHMPHLFDPFFTTKASDKGMGLGLSVSYGIIQNAHGTIKVESKIDTGSTFRVSLPACEA